MLSSCYTPVKRAWRTVFLFNLPNRFEVGLCSPFSQMRRPSLSDWIAVASLWLRSPCFFLYSPMLIRQHAHSVPSPCALVDWALGEVCVCVCVCVCVWCVCVHASMCLLILACMQAQPWTKGDSDYFRPISALFLLSVSLG